MCGATNAAGTGPASTPSGAVTPLKTDNFTGTVNATGTTKSIDHVITLGAPGAITAKLDGWTGNTNTNDLDLYLFSGATPPAGTAGSAASATTTSRPETLTFTATAAGTYTFRVVAASGSGNYTLTVTHP